ncbi:MAG: hypothetical protein ACD_75C01354G0002 [uncultured bacterium]|nr:MAG: hypothetical protein ACD_75C01354G0002 [uncultured bacterium]
MSRLFFCRARLFARLFARILFFALALFSRQKRRRFAGKVGRKLAFDCHPEQPFALLLAHGETKFAMRAKIRLDCGVGRNPALLRAFQQPVHSALFILFRIDGDGRGPVHGQLAKAGEQTAVPIHPVRPDVDKVRVVDQLRFLHGKARHLTLHRYGKGAVLRIEDHLLGDSDAMELQPVREAGRFLLDMQIPVKTDIERRGRQHHRPALHEKLIDGEQLLVGQLLGRHHHEQVGLLRHPAIRQVRRGDGMLLAENFLQDFQAHTLALHAELRHRRH